MFRSPFFTIIVVCLNPGSKLKKTLDSIASQTFHDYEVIIKDGMSADGAPKAWERENQDSRMRLISAKDKGIYDAMNQAVQKARGHYLYFLNCGDLFYQERVLDTVSQEIRQSSPTPQILYGNILEMLTGQLVSSNPHMNPFACYRNVPCHQACFYERELLRKHPFRLAYQVRADYEHFLWCILQEKAAYRHLPLAIACYEGGGFSETQKNRKVSAREHKEIVGQYMTKWERFCFRAILLLTLAPLRTRLAEHPKTAACYNKIKRMVYGKNRDIS